MLHVTNQQIQKSPADFIFPRWFSVTDDTIVFSLFPRIRWYKICPKKVPLWYQNILYKMWSIFLVNHVPGNMPSLPIFPYLDSTHFSESNGIWYMVVDNQHLSRKISLSQHMLEIFCLNFGHLFKCQVFVMSFPCSYPLFLVISTILFNRIWWRTELVAYILFLLLSLKPTSCDVKF